MTGRARRDAGVRREEILDVTVDLIDTLGLASVRVADVAAGLGVSTGLVFYHFGTKDDLIADAFAHAVTRDLRRLEKAASTGTPVERLRKVLRLYGPTGRASGWRLWIDAWAVAQRQPQIRVTLRALDHRWQDILRGVVDDGVAAGDFTCPDPAAAVTRLSALVDGLSVAAVVHRSVSREDLRRWVAVQVELELGVGVETLD